MAGKLIGVHTVEFQDGTTTSTGGTGYVDMTGSTINYVTQGDNSSFLLRCDCQVYQTLSSNGGTNIHFHFNGTEYGAATTTATSDAWSRFGNGAPTNGSYNITRIWPLEGLGISKGTTVTAYLRAGRYSSSSGNCWYNYPGYSISSNFTIYEFEA